MATQLQIQANKQNAQLSTGPKDTTKTRKNAQKFGIFSKEIVVKCRDFQENINEFYFIFNELDKEYQPQTITEWFLVEEIADSYWRLKRIRKARKAHIEEKMITVNQEVIDNIESTDKFKHVIARDIDEEIDSMNHFGIKKILENKTQILERLEKGSLSETEIDELLSEFEKNEVSDNVLALPLEEKKKILEELYLKHCDFYWALDFIKTKQEEELSKLRKEIALCDSDLENLSQYETTLERKIYRAIAILKQIKKGLI